MGDTKKTAVLTEISFNGFILYTSGTVDQQYPESPVAGKITFEDFTDPEDARTVWRLLTQAVVSKLNKK